MFYIIILRYQFLYLYIYHYYWYSINIAQEPNVIVTEIDMLHVRKGDVFSSASARPLSSSKSSDSDVPSTPNRKNVGNSVSIPENVVDQKK